MDKAMVDPNDARSVQQKVQIVRTDAGTPARATTSAFIPPSRQNRFGSNLRSKGAAIPRNETRLHPRHHPEWLSPFARLAALAVFGNKFPLAKRGCLCFNPSFPQNMYVIDNHDMGHP